MTANVVYQVLTSITDRNRIPADLRSGMIFPLSKTLRSFFLDQRQIHTLRRNQDQFIKRLLRRTLVDLQTA